MRSLWDYFSQSAWSQIFRLTWIDYIRRKDLYVLASCMMVFFIATVTIRLIGISNRSTALFLMSSGLTLAGLLSALLAASFSARAFPEEFERRSLVPLMAKPVRHRDVLIGKYLACVSLAGGSYLLFVLITILSVPIVSGQHWTALIESVFLQVISLGFLSAAALALSFFVPLAVSALVSLLWYFSGGIMINVIKQSILADGAIAANWLEPLFACVPDVSLLSHIETFASAAGSLSTSFFAALAAYGIIWSCMLLAVANWKFRRIRL